MLMTGEKDKLFTTKIFDGAESEFKTQDGFRVNLDTDRLHRVLNSDNGLPFLILVSGTSESGKSYLGQKFVTDRVGHRFKIYKTIADLMESQALPVVEGVNGFDSVAFASQVQNDSEIRAKTAEKIALNYVSAMKETGVPIGVVETLKHPWLVKELEVRTDLRTLTLYIDAPFELRTSRQAKKSNAKIEDITLEVQEKDKHKAETKTDAIKKIADITVWNAGEIDTFDSFIGALEKSLLSHSKSSSSKTNDYS